MTTDYSNISIGAHFYSYCLAYIYEQQMQGTWKKWHSRLQRSIPFSMSFESTQNAMILRLEERIRTLEFVFFVTWMLEVIKEGAILYPYRSTCKANLCYNITVSCWRVQHGKWQKYRWIFENMIIWCRGWQKMKQRLFRPEKFC